MDSILQVIGLAISALAGAAAVLTAVAQVTAVARLRRSTEHLRSQFQATELSNYDRGIGISLYREDMAKLVALRALPVRYFAIPLIAVLLPILPFIGLGRTYARSSSAARPWSAILNTINEAFFGFPVPLLAPFMATTLVAGGLTGLFGVVLGRLHIEQDYLSESALEKEPTYWDGFNGSPRTMLTLGWLGLGISVITATGLALLASGTGALVNIAGRHRDDPVPVLALFVGGLLTSVGVIALSLFIRLERGEWHHEPLAINPVKTAEQNQHRGRSSRRILFWRA